MKSIFVFLFVAFSINVFSQVKVRGYYRKDGTYVQPHYRSNPDGNPYNNWSYPGNVNPYTGKVATGNPSTYLDNYYNRSNNGSSTNTNSYSTYTPSANSYPNSYNSTSTYSIYYVSADKLNIRSGPSTDYSVLTTLTYGTDLKIVSYSNYPWYMVKISYYDNNSLSYKTDYGYAHSSFLSSAYPSTKSFSTDDYTTSSSDKLLSTTTIPSSTYNSSSYKSNYATNSYYVSGKKLNVRSGPSTDYSVLTTLDFQEKIDVVSTANYPWYKVKVTYYDTEDFSYRTSYGFVHTSYISYTYPTSNNLENYSSTLAPPTYHPYGEGKGKIAVWTDCTDEGYLSIYVDDMYVGQITSYFTSSPDCSSSGTLSIIKKSGYYKLTAKGATKKWEGYVLVSSDGCQLQKLAK